MLRTEYLRSLSVRSCHFDGISAFDPFIFSGNFVLVNFRVFQVAHYIYHCILTLFTSDQLKRCPSYVTGFLLLILRGRPFNS